MDAPTLGKTLRDATRPDHRRLDHHPLLAPLVRHDLDLTAYANALAALHAAQSRAEAIIAQALATHCPDYPFTPRLADLEADLADLGRRPLGLAIAPLAPAAGPAALMGQLYVLEGSLLGAQVIAYQIARTLPQAPHRYFTVRDVEHRWSRFTQFAVYLCPPLEQEQAMAAALAMFRFFREHLDDCQARLG
ncbi:MAG: biliverdin-producing heme oxygenase [Pseudomonadota bacterium]